MIPSASEREPLTRFRRRRAVGSGSAGFTLVEILVVLLIIALLIALLFPAIGSAIRAARNAAVQSEIQLLSQALADFNSKNGFYPPSRIALNENGSIDLDNTNRVPSTTDLTVTDITIGQLFQRTSVTFRKLWPKVVLTSPSGLIRTPTSFYDFNGNGNFDFGNTAILQGHESLVFFLGGIPLPPQPYAVWGGYDATGTFSVIGFGKDPSNPFSNGITGANMYSNNRNPPLFEFSTDRLRPTASSSMPVTQPIPGFHNTPYEFAYSHGIPGYVDSLNSQPTALPQNFYAYFSTNPNGYDPNDVNLAIDKDSNDLSPLTLTFGGSFGGNPGTNSMTPNPYTTNASLPNASLLAQSPTYEKAQTFQIISAGSDGMYGLGGYYKANANTPALPNPGDDANSTATTNSHDLGVRNMERDNLTNFHNGKLD